MRHEEEETISEEKAKGPKEGKKEELTEAIKEVTKLFKKYFIQEIFRNEKVRIALCSQFDEQHKD